MNIINFLDKLGSKIAIPTIILTVFILILKKQLIELGVYKVCSYVTICFAVLVCISAIAGDIKNNKT